MSNTAPDRSHYDTGTPRGSDRAAALKWSVVLAALLVATAIDGMTVSDLSNPASDAMSELASITLPSNRCGPGCAIMVAANQTGDAFNLRAQD